MQRSDRAKDDDLRLSELTLVVNEPFGWPGPLRLSADQATVPAWLGWAALAAFLLYGGARSAIDGDTTWGVGLLAGGALAALLAWRFQREGVWVDADGVTTRDFFASHRLEWAETADIVSAAGGGRARARTWLERRDGTLLVLPHLTSKDALYSDGGLRTDLQILACWWRTGQQRGRTTA